MSTLGMTTVFERICLTGSISVLELLKRHELARIGDRAFDRRRRGRDRAREHGARALALAAFEVAVARAHRELTGRYLVAVHRDAHRAARLAPLAAGRAHDFIEPLGLRLTFDLVRARNDEQAHALRNLAA